MLGYHAVLEQMVLGNIRVEPFEIKHLGPNSLDLRLGDWVCRQKEEGVSVEWTDPLTPEALWDTPERIPNGKLWLAPGELVLGHTHERVGTFHNIVGELASRSSAMRMGIAVCVDAGLGDIGYDSHWTMEIVNHTSKWQCIPVHARIAQIKFHYVEGVKEDDPFNYQIKGGTYGRGDWSPEDMRPRSSLL